MAAQQVLVEWIKVVLDRGRANAFVPDFNVKLAADGLEQVTDRELGIEDVGDPAALGDLLQEAAADGGLAGADLTAEQHEAATAANAVEKVRQRLPMALAHEEVARVGCDGERVLLQPEEIGVHAPEHNGAAGGGQRRPASASRARPASDQAARAMVRWVGYFALAEAEHWISPESWPPSSITTLP